MQFPCFLRITFAATTMWQSLRCRRGKKGRKSPAEVPLFQLILAKVGQGGEFLVGVDFALVDAMRRSVADPAPIKALLRINSFPSAGKNLYVLYPSRGFIIKTVLIISDLRFTVRAVSGRVGGSRG